jgi:predicted acetyltransferase
MKLKNFNVDYLENIAEAFEEKESFVNSIKRMFNDGVTKDEWCWVMEEEEIFSVIIYAVFDKELEIVYINIKDFNNSDILKESLIKMINKGFNEIGTHIYSDKINYLKYIKLFQNNKFEIIQEKKSFLLESVEKSISPNRLTYLSLEEVGEEKFIKAIMEVTKNTLDQEDLLCIEEYGEYQAAINYFNQLKGIDYNEKMWKLAYKDDKMIGLIIPQVFSKVTGAINYIGVIPEKRGNGYIIDLLNKCIDILNEEGIKKIIADIDVNNFPLEKALQKVNFKIDSEMVVLKLK